MTTGRCLSTLIVSLALLLALAATRVGAHAADAASADGNAAEPNAPLPTLAVKSGDVLDICGDSITYQGQYSVFIEEYILACQPVTDVKTVQCGWGGYTAPAFAARMASTALTFSPTIATTCFGMNDGRYDVFGPDMEKDYREGLTKVIRSFKASGVRTIIVGSPGAVDAYYFKNPKHKEVTAAQYNETLGHLAEVGKEVAASEGVRFADLHTPMMDSMAKAKAALGEKYPVFGNVDGVHPHPNGHLLMAYGFLKEMGFDGNIGTITYDAAAGSATVSDGQRIVSAKSGEITVESRRYPFCFESGDINWEGNDGILPFIPFNADLNRYMLVVNGMNAPKAKITWGTESKEFTKAQLAEGINLAAEFLKNPFCEPFKRLDKAVREKQGFEQSYISNYLTNEPGWRKSLGPQDEASLSVTAGLKKVNAELSENCVKAVKPVTHTIKIEAVN